MIGQCAELASGGVGIWSLASAFICVMSKKGLVHWGGLGARETLSRDGRDGQEQEAEQFGGQGPGSFRTFM